MILLTLGLTLALRGVTSHAALHPADVDVFLEVPDLPALLEAYEEAPLMRLLRDDDLALSIQGLTGREFDFDEEWNAALQSVFPPEAKELVHSVQAISFSLAIPPPDAANGKGALSFTFVVDFAGGEQARAVLAAIVDGASSSEPHPNSPLEGTIALHTDALGDLPLWAVVQGPRLVLGGGDVAPSGFALRQAAGEGAGLAGDKDFRAGVADFDPPTGATVFQGITTRSLLPFLNIQPPAGEATQVVGEIERVLGKLPDFFGGKRCWRMQLAGGRFRTEMVKLDAPGTSPSSWVLGGRPLDPEWLQPVDPGAMLVYSAALNGGNLLLAVQEGLRAIGRQTGQPIDLETIDAELGIPLSEVFGQLGPGFVAYAKPLRGIAIPETYAWIELAEPDAFQAHIAALAETLGGNFPGYALRTRDYRVKNRATGERTTFPVTTLTIPPDLVELPPPISLSPSFTVTEGKLLVSLSPMHLKRELKRLYGGRDAERSPAEAADEARGPLEAWGLELRPSTESVIVMDWGLLIGGFVSMAKSLGPMLQLPFDAQALPEPETITQYFGPTVHTAQRLEGATIRRHEASFGPEVWLGAALAGFQVYRQMTGGSSNAISAAPPAVPEPARANGDDGQELATKMALQKVRAGLAAYQIEFGAYPAQLEDLVAPTDSFPEGFLDQKTIPTDGWGRPLRYESAPGGSSYSLRSTGANGVDEEGEGDDIRSR